MAENGAFTPPPLPTAGSHLLRSSSAAQRAGNGQQEERIHGMHPSLNPPLRMKNTSHHHVEKKTRKHRLEEKRQVLSHVVNEIAVHFPARKGFSLACLRQALPKLCQTKFLESFSTSLCRQRVYMRACTPSNEPAATYSNYSSRSAKHLVGLTSSQGVLIFSRKGPIVALREWRRQDGNRDALTPSK